MVGRVHTFVVDKDAHDIDRTLSPEICRPGDGGKQFTRTAKGRFGAARRTDLSPTVQSQPQVVSRASSDVLGEFDGAAESLEDLATGGGCAVEARAPAGFVRAQEGLQA